MNREFASESGSRVKLGQVAEFNLGAIRVSPARRLIQVNGDLRTLEPRVMQVLVVLAKARPNVVPRDELVDACWGGVAVGDDAINRCIVALRRLARGFDPPPFAIDTVPRVGYSLKELGGSNRPPVGQTVARLAWLLPPMIIAAVAIVGALLWWQPWRSDDVSIAVVSASPSSNSEGLARDLAVKLGMLNSVTEGNARLLDQTNRERADFTFDVDSSADGQQAGANLVMRNDRREIIWSKDFSAANGSLADLKQQAANMAGKVLECALETRDGGKSQLDPELIKLYLNGCAQFADLNEGSMPALVTLFTRVADRAPAFHPVWPRLLMTAQIKQFIYTTPDFSELRRLVDRAKQVDPALPEIVLAQATLLPAAAITQRMTLIEHAALQHPDNVNVLGVDVGYLQKVGRLSDAVAQAKRAVTLDPISPAAREQLILELGMAGRLNEADQELRNADALWPGALSLRSARYLLYLRFGDPKKAIRFREAGGWMPGSAPYQVSFLAARVNPTPENVEWALSDARGFYAKEPGTIFNLAQTLGAFGREDELYSILLDQRHPIDVEAVLDIIFRPALHLFRRDPRFIRVAERLGLLDYWQKSGKWPDLCNEPDLPYDCKREAAKIISR